MQNDFITLFEWKILIAVAIITSFATEAVNRVTPNKLSSKMILPAIALVVTLLRLPWEFDTLGDTQQFGLHVIVTMAFSVLFYNYLGSLAINAVFDHIKRIIEGLSKLL